MTRVPLWNGLVKFVVMILTMYDVICDNITDNLMKLFAGSSKEVLIFSLLTKKTASISKNDTK